MKDQNQKFFRNLCDSLDKELVERVPDCIRYIATNSGDKNWLMHVKIKRIHRFSKNAYGLLLLLHGKEYLCLINVNVYIERLPDVLQETIVSTGLVTLLGAEGLLTPKVERTLQGEIFDKVLYETVDNYHGHEWKEIEQYFPSVYCYEITLKDDTVDIRENINAFYWVLAQVAIEFEMGNNPFSVISKDAWEKIVYEGSLDSIQFKNILLAYTSLSWDISFLYLYQCLEDKFAYESVQSLYHKLGLDISPQTLSRMLYDELSWQPKDLDGINKIIERCSSESHAIKILKSICDGQEPAKFIYSMRNRIVHETRETFIPLTDDEHWEKVITAMLYLLNVI